MNPLLNDYDEPLTTVDMIQELLYFAREHEWVWTSRRCPRGCCDESAYFCSSCDVEQSQDHKPDCRTVRMFQRAEAFLRVEEIERGRAEAVPHYQA
jgi:hypothetical protein